MARPLKVFVLPVFCLCLTVPAGVARAADCGALLQKAKKEFSVIKRRQMLEQSLAVCPSDPELNYEYGYSFERFRKYDKALSYYRKALSLRPGLAKAYFGIGDIERSRGNLKAAREAYEKGMQFDRENTRVLAQLNQVRKSLGLGPYKFPAKKVAARPAATPADNNGSASVAMSPTLKAITRLKVHFAANSDKLDLDARDVIGVLVGQAMLNDDLANVGLKVVGIARDPGLAKRRAEKVRDYLLNNFAISSKRLLASARLLTRADKGGGVEFVQQ